MALSVKQWCMIINQIRNWQFHSSIFLLILLLPFSVYAKIRGLVKDAQTHDPVYNVDVSISGVSITTHTDSSGIFTFDSIGPGSWNLLFTHAKYEPYTLNDVFVVGEQQKYVEVELFAAMQKLDKVGIREFQFFTS